MLLWTLVATTLLLCDGESSQRTGPLTVIASVGEDVLLPCSFDIFSNNEFPTVEWSKDRLIPDIVLLHRDGCEIQEMKHQLFEYRTSLIIRELKNGNISLRLSAVRPADQGTYRCKSLWTNNPDNVTTVQLIVVAVSIPTLSLTEVDGDGAVTVECNSGCWWPRPYVELLGDGSSIIYPEAMEEDRSSHDCFMMKLVATLQRATHRVICRVQHPGSHHSLETTICLPALCVFNHYTVAITAVITALSTTLVWSCLIIYRETQRARDNRTSSSQKKTTGSSIVTFNAAVDENSIQNVTVPGTHSFPQNSPTNDLTQTQPLLDERHHTVDQSDRCNSVPVQLSALAQANDHSTPSLRRQDSVTDTQESTGRTTAGADARQETSSDHICIQPAANKLPVQRQSSVSEMTPPSCSHLRVHRNSSCPTIQCVNPPSVLPHQGSLPLPDSMQSPDTLH